MLSSVLTKIFKTKNEREVRRLQRTVDEVNALDPTISRLSDEQLRAKTEEFRKRIRENTKTLSGELETLRKERAESASDEEKQKMKEILDNEFDEFWEYVKQTLFLPPKPPLSASGFFDTNLVVGYNFRLVKCLISRRKKLECLTKLRAGRKWERTKSGFSQEGIN